MKISDKDVNILKKMICFCDKIESTINRFGKSFDDFVSDSDYIDSVSMNILQIGELTGNLSVEYVRETLNEMNWRAIKGMRNIFAHAYGSMDIEQIWDTAINDVPKLKNFCENELSLNLEQDILSEPTMSM